MVLSCSAVEARCASFTWYGVAYIVAVGFDTASWSPLRSKIEPREAVSLTVR